MRKICSTLLTVVFLSFAFQGYSAIVPHEAKDKMLMDLDIIKAAFEVKYAPKEWKRVYADWDLEEQINCAKVKVLETPEITIKDYQRILLEFFNSTKDYHVGVSFYSTEAAVLPFRIYSADKKYYIAWALEHLKDSPKKGDEVLFFDGVPIDQAVQLLKSTDFGNPLSLTDQALAEMALTMRTGLGGNLVPQGPISVTVRKAGTDKQVTYAMKWLYFPEEISNPLSSFISMEESKLLGLGEIDLLMKSIDGRPLGQLPFFYKDMTAPLFRAYKTLKLRSKLAFKDDAGKEDEDNFIGDKKSFVPRLGKVVWQAPDSSPFDAYIYLNGSGERIGYIRIAHYLGASKSVAEFVKIINLFQQSTQALVVDQVNNPGGSLFYMYALASVLADRPLSVPSQQMTITQEDVFFAIEEIDELKLVKTDEKAREVIGSDITGYPVDLEFAQGALSYLKFIIQEWNAGRFFTNAGYLYGVDFLKPHLKGNYTKPILLLVNELDLSCGDFFPAILQDNKRAVVFGTRTAGAGGYVLEHSYPNLFGVQSFSFTGSIAQRADLNPIENLGVVPDILVELTSKDLENGYLDFKLQIQKAVSDLLERR